MPWGRRHKRVEAAEAVAFTATQTIPRRSGGDSVFRANYQDTQVRAVWFDGMLYVIWDDVRGIVDLKNCCGIARRLPDWCVAMVLGTETRHPMWAITQPGLYIRWQKSKKANQKAFQSLFHWLKTEYGPAATKALAPNAGLTSMQLDANMKTVAT